MSRTELYYITPTNRIVGYMEFRNSHLGAMNVWINLYRAHFEERIMGQQKVLGFLPHGPITNEDYSLLWGLWKNKDIPIYERAILGSTFDMVILEKEHFNRFYDDVMKFAVYYSIGTLYLQAIAIKKLSKRNIIGVCWNQTSVNGDMYSLLKESAKTGKLWSLYKELERIESEER